MPMQAKQADPAWLADPEVFAVNRLKAHSDHIAYADAAQAALEQESSLRQSLNGSWRFHFARCPAKRPADFYRADFNASAWGNIRVPGHMELQGHGQIQYVNTMYPWDGKEALRPPEVSKTENAVGSYLTDFTVAEGLAGKRVVLSFQGVATAFYVWVNGIFIGYSEDGFTPAEFDISDALRPGSNRLAVEVYQRSSASWIEDQDFWRLSGIFRDVFLYAMPAVHLENLWVSTALSDNFGAADVEAKLRFAAADGAQGTFDAVLYAPDGTSVWERSGIPARESQNLSIHLERPALWSAEEPNLYKLLLTLRGADGAVLEAVPQDVGLRRFELRADHVMVLNGRRIVFKGVNRHEFDHRRGRAVTREDMLWDIRFCKRHNINAVRTCHYPNQGEWYRLCDRYGIYLIDEANLESHGSWQKMGAERPDWVVPGDRPEWLAACLDRAASMLERDKNHASVLIWSCGNESFGGLDIFKMSEYFRNTDPTRLVHYEGIFHDRRYNATSDMEGQMYTRPEQVEEYLRNDPQKPFILCEYMHAMGNSLGGIELYTRLADRYPLYQGGFIWDFIDQAILTKNAAGEEVLAYGGDFFERPTDYDFCGNGIVYADRQPSPKAAEVKQVYQNVRLLPDRGGVRIRNQNLFLSTGGYALRYTLLKDGAAVYAGVTSADVAPGEEAYLPLALPKTDAPGEYALHAALCLQKPTLWAEAGFEVAFGQTVWKISAPAPSPAPAAARVVEGDVNVGVYAERFFTLFSLQAGGPISLRRGEREFITRAPKLIFWRAMTSNDAGSGFGFDNAFWYAADKFQKCDGVQRETTPQGEAFTYTYLLPGGDEDTACTLAYRVGPDGRLHVDADYPGFAGLPDLPLFGFQLRLPAAYGQFRYYGLGPDESYIDRSHGGRLGIFENTAAQNLSHYLNPQECGNRVGVRWLEVSDSAGHGLRFAAQGVPFECNVLPYTAAELENAAHADELSPVRYTTVSINARQMGVGGDDSWGAPVHPQFCLPAREPLHLSFTVEPL